MALGSGHCEEPSARDWLDESRAALSAQAPVTPQVPCLSGFEKRAGSLKRERGTQSNVPCQKILQVKLCE